MHKINTRKVVLDRCKCGRYRKMTEWVYLTEQEEYHLGQKEAKIQSKTCPVCREKLASPTAKKSKREKHSR